MHVDGFPTNDPTGDTAPDYDDALSLLEAKVCTRKPCTCSIVLLPPTTSTSVSSEIVLHQAGALPLVILFTAVVGPLHCDL
jgi:hypothetical protein